MDQTIRSSSRITLGTLVFAAFSLAALAQPNPIKTDPTPLDRTSPSNGPVVLAPNPVTFGPPGPLFTPALNGSISSDDYRKYITFQQHMNDDPAIKDLNDKVSGHIKEIQRLQAEANVLREKLISANPEIKAIRDRIMASVRARPSTGPVPLPVPAKGN